MDDHNSGGKRMSECSDDAWASREAINLFTLLTSLTVVQYLNAFRSRPEAASDVIPSRFMRPIVPDKRAKFRDPCLNRSRNRFFLNMHGTNFVSGTEVGL